MSENSLHNFSIEYFSSVLRCSVRILDKSKYVLLESSKLLKLISCICFLSKLSAEKGSEKSNVIDSVVLFNIVVIALPFFATVKHSGISQL